MSAWPASRRLYRIVCRCREASFFIERQRKRQPVDFCRLSSFFYPRGFAHCRRSKGNCVTDKPSPTSTFSGEVDWVLLFFRCFFSGFNCVFMFFYCALLCYKVFFLVSLYSARFWKKIYGFFRILLGFIGLYQFRIDLTSTYRASISSTEFHLTFIDLNVVFYILMGFIGLLRAYELEDWTGSCLVSRYYLCFLMTASL